MSAVNYGKFRSKQTVIEAMQFNGFDEATTRSFQNLQHFTEEPSHANARIIDDPTRLTRQLEIYDKLHDTWIKVTPGQWIIKGTEGEFYPCDDVVLQKKYELVSQADLDKMDFGDAIKAAKAGNKIARRNWNAQGQYVYHVPAASYPASTEIARREFGLKKSSVGPDNKIMVPYTAYMAIKTVQDTVAPWLASQTDMLADDWYVVES